MFYWFFTILIKIHFEADFGTDSNCAELNKLIKTTNDQNVANFGSLKLKIENVFT